MTTYAYPITLYEYIFDELENLLKAECERWESEGHQCYNPETGEPTGTPATILEIMKEARQVSSMNRAEFGSRITFTLTDYLFIPLENLLKEKCRAYKEGTGNNPFDPITGEPQCSYASMLEGTKLAVKNMSLNSYSTFVETEPIRLWSPKRSVKD